MRALFLQNTLIGRSSMQTERQNAIKGLETLISILSNTELPISEEDRKEKTSQLEQGKLIVQNRKYHVTTLGIFSTGKSTMINAMIGGTYLPSADNPTTARIVEIRPSKDMFVVLQSEKPPTDRELAVAEKFLSQLGYGVGENGNIRVLTEKVLDSTGIDGDKVRGFVITGTSERPMRKEDVCKILTFLGAETRKVALDMEDLVMKLKKAFTDIVVGLPVCEWMSDIVLTDAPGTGSIVEAHETVINKIIPESQLVLHVVDSERVGESTDKLFSERIANFQHRKIFYVMNKIDRMSREGCEEAQMEMKKMIPSGTAESCAPEVLQVSALCALLAMELESGSTSIEEIMNNRKLSLAYLYADERFSKGTKEQQRKILHDELWTKSNFTEFQDRVSAYLRRENKQLAIVEDAWSLIRGLTSDIKTALENACAILSSNTRVLDLEGVFEENQKEREELKKIADRALKEYDLEIKGGIGDENHVYDGASKAIRASFENSQENLRIELRNWLGDHYDGICKNQDEMRVWIRTRIERAVTAARNIASEHAEKAVARLKMKIVDVLREARDLSLVPVNKTDGVNASNWDTSIALLGLGVIGGGTLAGAGTGAGIGAAIGSVVPGAGTALGAAIGAGTGAVAGLVTGSVWMSKKSQQKRIDKIVSQVDESVRTWFFEVPGASYNEVVTRDFIKQCDCFRNDIQKKIDLRFDELGKREKAILNEISASKDERARKMTMYSNLLKECDALIKEAC